MQVLILKAVDQDHAAVLSRQIQSPTIGSKDRLESLITLCFLAKHACTEYVLKSSILPTLLSVALTATPPPSLLPTALPALFDIITHPDFPTDTMLSLPSLQLTQHLLRVASQPDTRREATYWSLAIVHEFVSRGLVAFTPALTHVIPLLAKLFVDNQGSFAIQKLALHTLSQLIATDPAHTRTHFATVLDAGILPPVVLLLRALDPELCYLGIGFIHGL